MPFLIKKVNNTDKLKKHNLLPNVSHPKALEPLSFLGCIRPYIICFFVCFVSIWIFFPEHSRFTGQQGKGEAISVILLYNFHPLHRHLNISRAIPAESSPLHIVNREPLVSERKSLTTKLRAQYVEKSLIYFTQ